MTRLLDDSFQADSSEDDLGFEVEESLNPLYITGTHQLEVTNLVIHVVHV